MKDLKNCKTCGDVIRKDPRESWAEYREHHYCNRDCWTNRVYYFRLKKRQENIMRMKEVNVAKL